MKQGMFNAYRRPLIYLLAVILIIAIVPTVTFADTIASGTCGDNLTWTLSSGGTLIISGTGSMWGYTDSSSVPWYSNREDITSVVIESGVTSVGLYAFYYCTNLTSVTIPNSVTIISWYAFYNCRSLTSITIPSNVTSIGKYAFSYSGLTSVTIPSSVTSIGVDAFKACGALSSMKVASGNSVYHSSGNCIIETASKTLIAGCKSTVIPSDGSVTSIGDSAFYICASLTSITIPNSVTSIGDYAFYACTSLTSVTIGKGVTSIGEYAFYYCPVLTSITIPSSVTSIGEYAFAYCYRLTSVTIPASVTSMGQDVFHNCDKLTTAGPIGWGYNIEFGWTSTIPMGAFYNCNCLEYVYIPNGVTSIERAAFYFCNNLTTLIIPKSVTKIGAIAIDDTLTDIYYGGSESDWTAITGVSNVPDSATIHYTVNIVTEPEDVTVFVDNTAQFTVDATGDGLTYKWIYRTGSSGSWMDCSESGCTTNTLRVTATAEKNGYQYSCRVTDAYGNYKWTRDANLYVFGITKQPSDAMVSVGSTAKFTVSAVGNDDLSYQWQYRTSSSGDWKDSTASGATTDTVSVKGTSAKNGYQYRCVITGVYGSWYYYHYTDAVTLYVYGVTKQPSDANVSADSTAKFSVTAIGKNVTYQWQYRTGSSGSWKNSGATGCKTKNLSVKGTTDRNGYQYRCKISATYGNATYVTYSKAATLYVFGITKQPGNTTVSAGSTAKFSVTATGNGLKYQWQYRTGKSGSWKKSTVSTATKRTVSVTATASKNGYQYRCKITDANGNVAYSNAATLSVNSISITQQPISATVSNGATVKFSVTASGSGLKYQWQYRTGKSGSWKSSSATGYKTNTLSVKATVSKNGYQYRCKITDTNGVSKYTSAATLSVSNAVITKRPSNATVSAGSTAKFSVTTTGNNLTYQWQYRTSKTGSWKNSSATGYKTKTLSVKATTARNGYQYRCKITDANGVVIYTNTVTLTVK